VFCINALFYLAIWQSLDEVTAADEGSCCCFWLTLSFLILLMHQKHVCGDVSFDQTRYAFIYCLKLRVFNIKSSLFASRRVFSSTNFTRSGCCVYPLPPLLTVVEKFEPGAHFYHAVVHSSLITPFRWYKLGLSHTVGVMDYRGRYETHWSIPSIGFCVSRLCDYVGVSLLLQVSSALIKNSFVPRLHSAQLPWGVTSHKIIIYAMQI